VGVFLRLGFSSELHVVTLNFRSELNWSDFIVWPLQDWSNVDFNVESRRAERSITCFVHEHCLCLLDAASSFVACLLTISVTEPIEWL